MEPTGTIDRGSKPGKHGNPEPIGHIIKKHFNWETYMETYIDTTKMKRIYIIDSDKALETHKKLIYRMAGENFVLTEGIAKVLPGLIYYFNGNADMAKSFGMDLSKGIALVGAYGIGKTILMQIIHDYLNTLLKKNPNQFWITSIDKMIEVMLNGSDTMDNTGFYNTKYGLNNEPQRRPIHVLINEFGVQYDIKKYGSDINDILDMMIMRRYEIFQQYGKVTHVTMNCGTDELEANFHPRIIDRFQEMFNIVPMEGKSFRSRKKKN